MHQALSVFDMFKIGVGPSSSHTLGPWRAAMSFCEFLHQSGAFTQTLSVKVLLYGSLAKTGKGHGTDLAVQMGLAGHDPVTFDTDAINSFIDYIQQNKELNLDGKRLVAFDPSTNIEFLFEESLPYHPNGLSFLADLANGDSISQTYYSTGGGFVEQEGSDHQQIKTVELPFPINNSNELLHW